MHRRLETVEERRQEERFPEAGVAPASWPPGGETPSVDGRLGGDRRPDHRVALGVRVEDEARPIRCGHDAGDEVRHRDRILGDQGLLLCGERSFELGIDGAVDVDREPPFLDERPHLDRKVERGRPELGEPEAELLDEVERQAIAPGGRGAITGETSSTVSPGCTTAGKLARSPSQTMAFPSGSSQ